MNFVMPQFAPALPEISLLIMICLILLIDLFLDQKNRVITYQLSIATLVILFFTTIGSLHNEAITTFSGTFVLDPFAVVLKLGLYVVMLFVFLYSRDYLQQRDMFQGEFFILSLSALLGMMVLVSAGSMLTIYLGLELLSLSLYAMVAMQRDSSLASEAAMKYFVLGAMASAMLLYGMSIIYGVSGTLDLQVMRATLVSSGSPQQDIILVFGLVFMVVGIAFKLGAVPFHMWVPDVYHGAPTAVTLFISSAPKIAAFAMLMRLVVEALEPLSAYWIDIITIISVLSIVAGNVIAIAQTNIKRMLAYSGISHIGFILLGVIAGSQSGYSAGMYYALVYALMSMAGFGAIILLSKKGYESEQISDLAGLNQRHPWYALLLMIVMFSMAGMPPLVGFWAKLAVLQAVIDSGFIGLAVVAVLFSVIGAFYYIRIVKVMYFDNADSESMVAENTSGRQELTYTFSVNALLILFLGLFPSYLLELCRSVFGA